MILYLLGTLTGLIIGIIGILIDNHHRLKIREQARKKSFKDIIL